MNAKKFSQIVMAILVFSFAVEGGTFSYAASISGTVREDDGTPVGIPISGLHVFANDYATNDWIAGTNTDGNGDYSLNLPPGTYRVRACASCSGLLYVDEFYDDTYGYNEADPITITDPSDEITANFALKAGGTISGTVTREDNGNPIPGLQVFAQDYDTNQWIGGTNAKDDGSYSLVLPEGEYKVGTASLCSPDFIYAGEFYDGNDGTYDHHEAAKVSVILPDDTPPDDINFVLDGVELIQRGTIAEAIADGVEWLAAQQNPDGSWGTRYALAKTALALLKLETHAMDPNAFDPPFDSPLDPEYPYHTHVEKGLDFLFANADTEDIDPQLAGDPDGDGDGIGVFFDKQGDDDYYPIYNTGIVMMAIAASLAPDRVIDVSGSELNAWTYKQVLQDAVDYIAWAQTDWGYGKGGWNYGPMDDMGPRSDQSNSGWVTLGLMYAENKPFEVPIPGFVRSELDYWIDYTQDDVDGDSDDGGSHYSDLDGANILRTGNLLQQMAFRGDTPATPRVQDAIDYLVRHWDSYYGPGWRECPTCYQATYTTMKGLETFGIESIDSIDWFQDFVDAILAEQTTDGGWPISCHDKGERILSTEWALLTLQKAIPETIDNPDLEIIEKHEEWVDEQSRTYRVFYTVKNGGNIEVPSGHDVGLTIDGDDVASIAIIEALAPGATYSSFFDIEIALSGEIDEITVCADINDEILELNEDNNCKINMFELLGEASILKEQDFVDRGDGTVFRGDTISYAITIENFFNSVVDLMIYDALNGLVDYVSGTITDTGSGLVAPLGESFIQGIPLIMYTLDPDEMLKISFDVIVSDSAPFDSLITNVAWFEAYIAGELVDEGQSDILEVRVRNPIPEPSTVVFVGTGLLGILFLVRRRRR